MDNVINRLQDEIHKIGGKIKVLPISVMQSLQLEWDYSLKDLSGSMMYQQMLDRYFDFNLEHINSLIIIALPSPPTFIEVEKDGVIIEADIPPIYYKRDQQLCDIKNIVEEIFVPNNLHSYPVVLPKKMVGGISGFGKYGRNNLLYVEGMGTCHRLTVFASNLISTEEVPLVGTMRLERCEKCRVCMTQCPTGAIRRDQERIDWDRCITFYNETEGEFPDWIKEEFHNCIIGCNYCQVKCPENNGLWNRERIGRLTAQETQEVLMNKKFEELAQPLQEKLIEWNLNRYYPMLSRNLYLLL